MSFLLDGRYVNYYTAGAIGLKCISMSGCHIHIWVSCPYTCTLYNVHIWVSCPYPCLGVISISMSGCHVYIHVWVPCPYVCLGIKSISMSACHVHIHVWVPFPKLKLTKIVSIRYKQPLFLHANTA